jgi:hypothetical protein
MSATTQIAKLDGPWSRLPSAFSRSSDRWAARGVARMAWPLFAGHDAVWNRPVGAVGGREPFRRRTAARSAGPADAARGTGAASTPGSSFGARTACPLCATMRSGPSGASGAVPNANAGPGSCRTVRATYRSFSCITPDERKAVAGAGQRPGQAGATGRLEDLRKGPIQRSRDHHRRRQGQHPGERDVADCRPLQPGAVRRHGAGDP